MIKPMETAEEKRGKALVHYRSWQETYEELLPATILEKHSLDYCEQMAFLYPENTLIALVDGEVIGFCSYMTTQDAIPKGFISALYVVASHQQEGIGSSLLRTAFQELASYKTIQLQVLTNNQMAIDFYKHYGFVMTDNTGTFHGVKVIEMQRENPYFRKS